MGVKLSCQNQVILVTDDKYEAIHWNKNGVKVVVSYKEAITEVGRVFPQQYSPILIIWNQSGKKRMSTASVYVESNFHTYSGTIINRYARPWDSRSMRERLQLWGLPVADWATWADDRPLRMMCNYVRTICFWVNECRVIAAADCIQPPYGAVLYRPLELWFKPPYRRLARLATRAAYAVGWDIASVTMKYNSSLAVEGTDGWPTGVLDEPQSGDVIEHINPVPKRIPAWVRLLYVNAWRKSAMEKKHRRTDPTPFSLGLDVELILFDSEQKRIIPAIKYLPKGGPAGCDAIRIQGRIVYPLMELRPVPAAKPRRLIAHLQAAMRMAAHYITEKHSSMNTAPLQWLGGSQPRGTFPLGGHIHVSGIPLTADLVRALDTYVAIPLSVIEGRIGSLRRRPRYGTFGDVREHQHGGMGGFEYRTLPSFIMSPALTLEVLTLFCIVIGFFQKLKRRDSARGEVIHAYMKSGQLARASLSDTVLEKDVLTDLALELMEDLLHVWRTSRRKGSPYVCSADEERIIASLCNRIRAGWRWDEDADLSRTWL